MKAPPPGWRDLGLGILLMGAFWGGLLLAVELALQGHWVAPVVFVALLWIPRPWRQIVQTILHIPPH